ncbi:MAG TPA: dihydroorotate dehydrogenase [Candidatus Hydrogenedentes bacterium]|jgi:dihydroorotate dehydrogenase (NAD+) catalytic subunit|nr:dihydroorotate dehydrogenase [Candidatus Hydrogenedentota bacterium]MDY0032194.1 dihydroorotate dehydrogenase [FCB group bacterium]NLT61040.1 dihydroorotate dehydrogenase [Candidatus Hydrogenedentota bacterium]HNZ16870.1 dihydroorotate dehydrogenase [Candidatus Hydrogenedentota bacterium]HOH34103.1 dihydroorotate dehydrogenase [Candidatus Hydrogenedentota bacterium]
MTCDTATLAVNLGGLRMKNPVTVASGTFGYGEEFDRYFDVSLLGAVTTKSISLKPRAGNKPPRLVETPAGLLNAIGLQNVGIERFLSQKVPYLRKRNATIIANIYGYSPEEYAELARRLEAEGAADAIEANLSCPNVHDARTAKGAVLVSQSCEAITVYTRAIREATRLPLYIKLTPNVMNIQEPALAAEAAGADGVCLINTLLGMAINPETRKPRLANIVGGLSGPAIRPVAVKMVWDAARVLRIPIIGTGGISGAASAIEFLLAGATAVSVGSMSFRRPDIALRIVEGIAEYLKRHRIADVNQLIGAMQA